MTKCSSRQITTENVMLICIEALTVSVLVLVIINFVAGQHPHSLQGSPILTFDTSSVKIHLVNQGISNNVGDWYEPHYLSVCKGMWQSAATHLKNETSTVCMEMAAGYTFSLPELLAADAGLPADNPLFSNWQFAVLRTEMPFVCLVIAMTFISWTIVTYFFGIVATWRLTAESPPHWLRSGYIASIPALITLILSSAKITATAHKILEAKPVIDNEVVWSTSGFYVLTWLATGLMCVMVTLSVVLGFKLGRPVRFLAI